MHIKLYYVQHSVLLHITSIIQHMLVMICIYISVLCMYYYIISVLLYYTVLYYYDDCAKIIQSIGI